MAEGVNEERNFHQSNGISRAYSKAAEFIAPKTPVTTAIALAVDFYNNRRPHMSVGMMTPSEAAESTGERDMKWTSYRHLAIKSRDNLDIPENSLPLPTSNGSPSGLRPSVNPLQ